ncbi:3044_t:CDS:2, partial [Paraglomus occultum]
PKNLQELIEDFEIKDEEIEEFKKWIKEIPYNYPFYPHGLKYNGELLLYLLIHGFEKFFKEFFRNYTESNPDKFTMKQILQNKNDEIWFQEDKNKNEYEISKDLRVYLDDTNFKEINKLDSKE